MKVKRQQIIDTAIALISKQGYKATTMRQLAKECGTKTGGLYHYIDSKEQIILEIQTSFMDSILSAIKEDALELSAQERLERALERIIEVTMHNREAWKILRTELDFFPASKREKIIQKSQELEIAIGDIIEEGKKTGEFNDVNSKMVTLSLLGACHYISRWAEESFKPHEIGEALSSLFLKGLVNKEYRKGKIGNGELVPTWA